MPTQQQIEYFRQKHQKFSSYKMKMSMMIGVITSVTTAPFELLKVRAQLLQEGRHLHGFGAEKGVPVVKLFYEVMESGAGLRSMFTGYDSLLMRGIWGGGWRSYFWCSCYNYFNQDPRRNPYLAVGTLSSFLAGFFAGIVTNPIDIVYNRQVADALYPKGLNRNYSSFIDGLVKVNAEGALFRGAVASGASLGALMCSMPYVYDYLKEWLYFWCGPTVWLRPLALFPTAIIGVGAYLPFDTVKVRLHTMRPLPNGEMPYKGLFDAFFKITKYECSPYKGSNFFSFYNGFGPAFFKLYMTLWIGINITDYTFKYNYKEGELWEAANYYTGPQIGLIPHEPHNNFFMNLKYYSDNLPTTNVKLQKDDKTYVKL